MKWLRYSNITAIILFICLSSANAQTIVKASCMEDGRQIFRAEMAADTPAETRLSIANAYPKAMCVFLKTEKQTEVANTNNIATPSLNDAAPNDLAKALSFLSGGGEIGQPYGDDFDAGMASYSKTYNAFPMESNTINLTIGIYETTERDDVMEFWEYLKQNTKVLGRMTPTIQLVDNVAILSVENVSDNDAGEVCKEADQYASGCIAAY